jgi:hypothetical protein
VTQHDDDQLDARLRAADPATSLPEADPAWVARLLEDTMSNDVLTESRENGTHNRSPLTWLVAAAAAVIIAGVGIFAVVNGTGGGEPTPPPQAADPTVTQLVSPGEGALSGRCMVPNADLLSDAPVAFDGTVESISDGLVTLDTSHWYAGDPTDQVTVEAPSEELSQLLAAVQFKDSGRYLVAANDSGELLVCGFSAPYSQGLASLYDKAFAS